MFKNPKTLFFVEGGFTEGGTFKGKDENTLYWLRDDPSFFVLCHDMIRTFMRPYACFDGQYQSINLDTADIGSLRSGEDIYEEITIFGYAKDAKNDASFASIKNSIDNEEFDIAIFYNEGEKNISIFTDPKTIHLEAVIATIEHMSEKHGKPLGSI
ncbi:MAG: hypothetical protein LBS36_00085 [Oscillospiraceae bacterium]|jgi:hypothetical protein|nr:hypothetical protein [Oscillospiraceae bacterium]